MSISPDFLALLVSDFGVETTPFCSKKIINLIERAYLEGVNSQVSPNKEFSCRAFIPPQKKALISRELLDEVEGLTEKQREQILRLSLEDSPEPSPAPPMVRSAPEDEKCIICGEPKHPDSDLLCDWCFEFMPGEVTVSARKNDFFGDNPWHEHPVVTRRLHMLKDRAYGAVAPKEFHVWCNICKENYMSPEKDVCPVCSEYELFCPRCGWSCDDGETILIEGVNFELDGHYCMRCQTVAELKKLGIPRMKYRDKSKEAAQPSTYVDEKEAFTNSMIDCCISDIEKMTQDMNKRIDTVKNTEKGKVLIHPITSWHNTITNMSQNLADIKRHINRHKTQSEVSGKG